MSVDLSNPDGPSDERRGRAGYLNGQFLHFCSACGRRAFLGSGVRLAWKERGTWYCREHVPPGFLPKG